MLSKWSFFASNRLIEITNETDIPNIEKLFNLKHSIKLLPSNSSDIVNYELYQYVSTSPDSSVSDFKFFILNQTQSNIEVPTLIGIFSTDLKSSSIHIESLLNWFRLLENNSNSPVIWPVMLSDNQLMIDIADSIVKNKYWATTKFLFDIQDIATTNNNLRTISIEIDNQSCSRLYRNQIVKGKNDNVSAYRDAIIPYIYENSGILFDALPIHMINLVNVARIAKDGLYQVQDKTPSIETLILLLSHSQIP
ncbi:hypothetical protein TBLA_0B02410 [Henningerozyma blattae CBS 6284]|uniref:Uncharacterized protein n=1 Tax=Henningerozyma blattae (strain ATCC 34711 / CBS 6284 / DSM 70876 / NBRC 10599 / NRRL Y-10934 / UCD 77-7) TaxID=1071380 RepID=I2GY81_HENB6|nr:hypothetical protein TBLA_0B02410 [Tetrapisispora blattae CBS 6284]CCH59083.1 hypothetical protein TBLA_0B02410 [Tetrapisispora blattae CBS 6284]